MNDLTPQMVIDGLLIVVLLISAIRAYCNGFFTSIINLLGNVGSLIAAWFVSNTYSQQIFDTMIRESLITRSYNYLVQASESIDIETALNSVIGKWPKEFVDTILRKTEESLSILLTPTKESAVHLVDTFIAPIVVACITVVTFLLCYIIVKFICNLLAKVFKGLNNVPLLGFANKLAGFVAGLGIGGINIILLSFLLSIIIIVSGDKITWLNSRIISQSKILALTGSINPFLP